MKSRLIRSLVLVSAMALVAAACSNDAEDTTTTAAETTTAAPTTTEATTTTAAPTTTEAPADTTAPPAGVATDVGVTAEPCPGGDPDRGCINLGILTDLSGPFQAASPALVAAQQAFWATVNATGGIGGQYDVAVPAELQKDTLYDPATLVQAYNDIAGDVAAIAQSLGTSQTIAALEDYTRDSIVAAPMSWWSGWAFDESDQGRVLEFGTNYCFEAMNAVDWSVGALPAAGRPAPTSIGILAIPNDYGRDYSAGVKIAAEANGIDVAWEAPVIPISLGGDPQQVEAIQQVLGNPVDVVYLVTGPSETAAIVAGAADQGATNLWIGAAPSWNVGILATQAAPAFQAGIYFQSAFVGPWDTDTVGHGKMRAAISGAGAAPNDFFVTGWVSQYGVKAALEVALANGDLTRAGISAAAQTLTDVDYEGMIDPRSYGGDPATQAPRNTIMGGYDGESSTGISPVTDFFVGSTAQAHEFTAACAGA